MNDPDQYDSELDTMTHTKRKRKWHEQIERELQYAFSAELEVADCPVEYDDLERWYKADVPPECVASELYARLKNQRLNKLHDEPNDLCEGYA